MPTPHLWHLADKPLASQEEESALGTSTTRGRLRSGGRPEPDQQRESADALGDHAAKVQSRKGREGEVPEPQGAAPASGGRRGRAGSRLAEEVVQGLLWILEQEERD